MKYAYIFGSNAFVVPHGAISYNDNDQSRSFLSIRSVYHDTAVDSRLSVDINIKDMQDRVLRITDNQPETAIDFNISQQRDRILVTDQNGSTIIDVHQLDDRSAMHLEHNIVAELEVNAPVAVIRVRGNFMIGKDHVQIDNEKLIINGNPIANSVQTGHQQLQFAHLDVVL